MTNKIYRIYMRNNPYIHKKQDDTYITYTVYMRNNPYMQEKQRGEIIRIYMRNNPNAVSGRAYNEKFQAEPYFIII